ncbi:MAG: Rrf2 family transcriptional regulator [Blautia sp.]|nr:Rrf2 family transcriptional regulator [Blautia sp.]MDY4516069.1 Rrf2 family transcriptional regulator [Lachnospiraceae bacterium]
MKISTKGRYGLRALTDMAMQSQNEAISLVKVARRQHISLNYLEQVFATLRKAGIVKSQKGAQGGYLLAKKPEEIKVGDVLTALEGEFSIIDDMDTDASFDAVRCAIRELVWDRINQSVNSYLEEYTLAELIENHERLGRGNQWIYEI